MNDPRERTCYVSNLHENVTEELLNELFIQVGPVETTVLRSNGSHRYALIIFKHEVSVPFACDMLDRIELFKKPILVRPKQNSQQAIRYRPNVYTPQVYSPMVSRPSARKYMEHELCRGNKINHNIISDPQVNDARRMFVNPRESPQFRPSRGPRHAPYFGNLRPSNQKMIPTRNSFGNVSAERTRSTNGRKIQPMFPGHLDRN